jgi:hypothetical protein
MVETRIEEPSRTDAERLSALAGELSSTDA